MAEEKKKKGFWSWLGFGKKQTDTTEADPTTQTVNTADTTTTAMLEESQTPPQAVKNDEISATADSHSESQTPPQAVKNDEISAIADSHSESQTPPQAVKNDEISVATDSHSESQTPPQAVKNDEISVATDSHSESQTLPQAVKNDEISVATDSHSEIQASSQAVKNDEISVATDSHSESQTPPQAVKNDEISTIAENKPDDHYQEKPTNEGGFFSRLIKGLVKTKQSIGSGFRNFFRGKKIDDDLFEELEEQLLIADLGMPTTTKIINNLTQHATKQQLRDAELLYQQLKIELGEVLKPVAQPLVLSDKKPYVILMVGVNGVGKTTTIGKLARKFQAEGKSVMLAAGDTFRAAAVEQLQVWGERNQIPVVAQATGADSASVIFDAMQSAAAKGIDVLIADTAGRLQNKNNLMDELKKIVRVMKKYDETAPHEIMLTLDAGTGQNAISQAKLFNEAVGLTGITLTKLDGTAKGGVIFAIADQFNIPIRYIGVGEKIDDLRPFNAEEFIEALFSQEDNH